MEFGKILIGGISALMVFGAVACSDDPTPAAEPESPAVVSQGATVPAPSDVGATELEMAPTPGPMAAPSRSSQPEFTRHMVDTAIAFYEANGREAAIERFSSPASVDGQWYVFIIDTEQNDTIVAHPQDHRLGLDLKDWVGTDINGYEYGAEMLTATAGGKWVAYVYLNPETPLGKDATWDTELKNVWVVRKDGLLFASGWYMDTDRFTQEFVAQAVEQYQAGGLEGMIAYFASAAVTYQGLAATIEYYNQSPQTKGQWVAFVADSQGLIVDHYNKALVGKSLADTYRLTLGMLDDVGSGNWILVTRDMGPGDGAELLRMWVVEEDGMYFGSGWYADRS